MKNINRITFINLLSTLLLNCITFLTAPIFSRMLGVHNYGVISVYNIVTSIVVAAYGLQATGTYGIAKVNLPMEKQSAYQSSMAGLAITAFGLFSIITLLFDDLLANVLSLPKCLIICMLVHGLGQILVSALNSKFTLDFKADRNLILSLVTIILNVGISILLIMRMPAESNYLGRAGGMAAAYALVGLFSFIYLFARGKTFYKGEYWIFCLQISLPMIFHTLSGIVLNSSDKLMIQYLTNSEMVGLYGLALGFANIISMIWTSLNNTWVPFYCEYMRVGDHENISRRSNNYVELFSVLTMGFMLLTPEVFSIYAAKEFHAGLKIIPVLALGFYFVFLYSFPVNYEFFQKKTKTIAFFTVTAALINIALNYVMIQWDALLGASIATAVAHLLQFLLHFFSAMRMNPGQKKNFPVRAMIYWGTACIAVTVMVSFVQTQLAVVRWGIGIALGIFELSRIVQRKSLF